MNQVNKCCKNGQRSEFVLTLGISWMLLLCVTVREMVPGSLDGEVCASLQSTIRAQRLHPSPHLKLGSQ